MFNPADAPASWVTLPITLDRLTTKYALLLDIRLPGKRPDYILWEVVDIPNTFAASSLTPDCEHLALAILGCVDKAREGDSHDAAQCDSKLIFTREISSDPGSSERRGMGLLRAVCGRARPITWASAA